MAREEAVTALVSYLLTAVMAPAVVVVVVLKTDLEGATAGQMAAVAVVVVAPPMVVVVALAALALARPWQTSTVGRAALAIPQTVVQARQGQTEDQSLRAARRGPHPYPDCQVTERADPEHTLARIQPMAVAGVAVVDTHAMQVIPSRQAQAFHTTSLVVAEGGEKQEATPATAGRVRYASSTPSVYRPPHQACLLASSSAQSLQVT